MGVPSPLEFVGHVTLEPKFFFLTNALAAHSIPLNKAPVGGAGITEFDFVVRASDRCCHLDVVILPTQSGKRKIAPGHFRKIPKGPAWL